MFYRVQMNHCVPALLATIGYFKRYENRVQELVHEAGGRIVPGVHDEVIVEGLTDEQHKKIVTQLQKEFPL